jgi:hypothetical protein
MAAAVLQAMSSWPASGWCAASPRCCEACRRLLQLCVVRVTAVRVCAVRLLFCLPASPLLDQCSMCVTQEVPGHLSFALCFASRTGSGCPQGACKHACMLVTTCAAMHRQLSRRSAQHSCCPAGPTHGVAGAVQLHMCLLGRLRVLCAALFVLVLSSTCVVRHACEQAAAQVQHVCCVSHKGVSVA